MKFEYTGRHLEVTPALRSHVEKHFKKISHLFGSDSTRAHIIIEVEKGKHRAEVVINWRDHVLTANQKETDMYQSLSKVIEKVEKQAMKLKNKVVDKKQSAKKAAVVALKFDDSVKPEPMQPQIIKSERYAIKPMTPEEAVLQLKMEDNQFLVYRDAETERTSVIYSRADGNFGLIEP